MYEKIDIMKDPQGPGYIIYEKNQKREEEVLRKKC
jgi:hypothetical protein